MAHGDKPSVEAELGRAKLDVPKGVIQVYDPYSDMTATGFELRTPLPASTWRVGWSAGADDEIAPGVPSMDAIDRAAAAWMRDELGVEWTDALEWVRVRYRNLTISLIRTLLEPSMAMIEAGRAHDPYVMDKAPDKPVYGDIWRAMVNAMLGETKPL